MQTKKRFLFLFDFDNTIVDQNTDTYIWKLLPEGENSLPNYIMEDIRNKVWIRTWNKFMRKVLQHYYHINISPDQIKQCLQEMHLSPGFQNLFQFISQNQEIIESSIVSDSNTFFIGSILEKQNLTQLFTKVLSNPVHVIDNVELDIRPFHKNNCQSESCPYNQCKQKAILDNYNIEEYEQVCYFGDGRNDYCACKVLRPQDYAFARKGYQLDKMLIQDPLQCKVVSWDTGDDIIEVLKNDLQIKINL